MKNELQRLASLAYTIESISFPANENHLNISGTWISEKPKKIFSTFVGHPIVAVEVCSVLISSAIQSPTDTSTMRATKGKTNQTIQSILKQHHPVYQSVCLYI